MDLSPHSRLGTLPRVAILIDGDNIPRTDLDRIEDAAANMGRTTLRRVFADISHRKDWACEAQYLVTHCSTKHGKNRADMQMNIAALDIAHRGLATGFIIASDDSDFVPLLAYLTEQGFSALRIRKAEPPEPTPDPAPIPKVEPTLVTRPDVMPVGNAEQSPEERVQQLLAQAKGGRLPIATFNAALKGFHVSKAPQKTWRNWLIAKGFTCDPKGPLACVWLSPGKRN